MEKQVLVLPFVCLMLGSLSGAQGSAAQEFCHGMVCPEYTVVQKYEGYEERSYVETRWITSKVPSDRTTDLIKGYSRLKKYCQGQNEAGTTVSMDAWPALLTVTTGEGDTVKGVTVSWYASAETVLPKPTDPLVVRERRPAATVYVRSFGGLEDRKVGLSNVKELRGYLEQAGKSIQRHNYTGADYDSPFDILNPHHNEVWITAA